MSASYSDRVSSRDIGDVIRLLGANDLHELFQVLNIKDADIEKEEINAHLTHPDHKARSVFNFWRKLKADSASRQAILDALKLCGNIEAKENLEDIWDGKDSVDIPITDFYDVIKPLGPDQYHGLYDILGISQQDVEKSEASASTNDTEQKAKAILRCWKKRKGKRASLDELRQATKTCSKVYTKETTKVDFDLESVRRQLKEEYKQTRGTLPLLPGMPEEFARMEDIFVDLQIIEEDKMPSGAIAKELPSYGDLVCIKRKNRANNEKGEEQIELVKRILVRGKPGAGKSTAVSKLAYDWACNKQDSSVSNFQLMFAITINKIDRNTDIIDIIRTQLLPEVSFQGLKDYIKSNASSIALVFDGYDEATESFHQCKDIRNILCSKWLAEACVIVTSRVNQTGKFQNNYGSYLQVEVTGFSEDGRERYVRKFMQVRQECKGLHETDDDAVYATRSNYTNDKSKFFENVYRSLSLSQLSLIPIILSMLCLLWVSHGIFPTTVTALYQAVMLHLVKHKYAKGTKDDLDEHIIQAKIDDVLNSIGGVALNGLFDDRLVFQSNEFIPSQLKEACELGLVTKERHRSGTRVVYSVQFIHKTFQEICAAFYWGQLIETDIYKFKSLLQRICGENLFEMEYLLRFACGLNIKTAEFVLQHIVQVMCEHPRLTDMNRDVHSIFENDCQQLPIFLVYESEMNRTDGEKSHQLHALLKPLYDHVRLEERSPYSSEFYNVCNHYITQQHTSSNARSQRCPIWLDDVKMVKVKSGSDDGGEAKLLCAMPSVSVLHFTNSHVHNISSFLSVLVRSHYSPSSISELIFNEVTCDANQFLMFLSSIPSVVKLVLDSVNLNGESSAALSLPELKELYIKNSPKAHIVILKGVLQSVDAIIEQQHLGQPERHCSQQSTATKACIPIDLSLTTMDSTQLDVLFDGLIAAGKMETKQDKTNDDNKMQSGIQSDGLSIAAGEIQSNHDKIRRNIEVQLPRNAGNQPDGLSIEVLDLSHNDIGDSVEKLAQAFRYMPRLKCLRLEVTCMNPAQFAVLFGGFIAAGEIQSKHDKIRRNIEVQLPRDAGNQPDGLSIEELDLSNNEIGDSVEKLAQAYRYMTRLRCLRLDYTSMNPAQCAVFFDGFIAAGEIQSKHDKIRRNIEVQLPRDAGNQPDGLSIEELDLSNNEIGDSVEKLAQAYRYMTRLRCLRLDYTSMNPAQCAVFFDGFIAAGEIQSKHDKIRRNIEVQLPRDAGNQPDGLSIEELDLSNNEIGDSVEKLAQAFRYMTRLRCLRLDYTSMNPAQCAVFFDVLIAAGTFRTNHDKTKGDSEIQSCTQSNGLNIEEFDLSRNEIGDSVGKLVKAYRYMTRLRCLRLESTRMNSAQWAVLFDGFIAAGEIQTRQNKTNGDSKMESATQPDGLSIEELDLSKNEIGDSVGKLVKAYRYMARLRCLRLESTDMNPAQWAVLFDGFIAAGKKQTRSGEMTSSDTQGNSTIVCRSGLNIETLIFSSNTLSKSADKLVEALRYMPHLKELQLAKLHLRENTKELITRVLKDINSAFAYGYSTWSVH